MTPRKIFLFGLYVVAIIFTVSVLFPGGWDAGALTLRYPDYRRWFSIDTVEHKNIQAIIASVDTADHQNEPVLLSGYDSIPIGSNGADRMSERTPTDVYNNIHPFEYPQGQDTLLYTLFRVIGKSHQRNKPVRILHYGDSQIETDRITATIRDYMQKNYGGQGIGFLPIVPSTDVSVTFQQDLSPNWKRFTIIKKEDIANNRFGISGNLTRYIPSDGSDSIAHIGLLPYYIGYKNARTFTHARLFYGQARKSFTIVVNQVNAQRTTARKAVSSAWWQFESSQNSLDLSIVSSELPDLYGIALDGARGVAVDNLPLRGSSGLDFSRMDTAQMGDMFRMMDVKMLILQFGSNIVPHVVDNYDYYMHKFTHQLQILKELNPGLAIVVIGVNDISQNSTNGYESYPNIVKIRDTQKKAAFDAGCVFWDLYEAMGGENSMPGWVFADPPLAQKDFVHFTVKGAKIVAELFCRAWEKEYQRFASHQNSLSITEKL